MRARIICCVFFFMVLVLYLFFGDISVSKKNCVRVYNWYGVLSRDLIRKFTKETGIHVQYDVYDSNDILEAKLLAGNSGYDVVFPSGAPYGARQIRAGAYQPFNRQKLPNLCSIDQNIIKLMGDIDPEFRFLIPIYFGTIGFAIDQDCLDIFVKEGKINKDDLDSFNLLFSEKCLKELSPKGVSFLSESTDIYPLILHYMGESPHSIEEEGTEKVTRHLLKIRPYIKRFASGRFMSDILSRELCLAQCWSGDAHQLEAESKSLGRRIKYIAPREGTGMWVDCMAIPQNAPNVDNAHIFINFMLRADVCAEITNSTRLATACLAARPLIAKEIRESKTIFPDPVYLKKCFIETVPLGKEKEFAHFDQKRTRAFASVLNAAK